MKIAASIFKTFFLSLCIIANTHLAFAQTASILPQGKTQFLDNNGKPLTSGTIDFYTGNISSTTRKATWQNSGETVTNTNPVILDAGGRAIIYGDGSYRQVVKDRLGNIIWDQLTSSSGSGSSAPTATGDGDLVGTIKPWAGMTAPNQYAFTYGQELSRTTNLALFTAITSSQATFCSSGSAILTGLTDTTNFWIGSSVEISCVAAGFSTIVSKTPTTVTLAVNANVTVNVNARFLPWGRGNGTTTFNVPDFRGLVPAGNNIMGGVASSNLTTTYFGSKNPNSVGAQSGNEGRILLLANLPAYTPTGSIANGAITSTFTGTAGQAALTSSGGAQAFAGGGFASSQVTGTVSSTQATSTFTGVAQGGSSVGFSIIQPTQTTNYIIKITPDANSATASGVTSLGGMTGDIACGTNVLCSGNTISISGTFPSLSGTNVWTGNNYFGALSPWCDVKAYGAQGDGVTDDTPAFNACKTIIQALGTVWSGTIFVPPSSNPYCLSTGFAINGSTIAGGITLKGSAEENSILSACGHNVKVLDLNASYVNMEHITVVGYGMSNITDDPFSAGANPAVLFNVNCTSCRMDKSIVFGGSINIYIEAYDVRLQDIVAQYAYGEGSGTNRAAIVYSKNSGYWLTRAKLDQVWPVTTPAHGTTISAWTNAHAYSVGDVAIITQTGVPYYVQASVGGTSGATAPALKIYNQTITDGAGTLRWLLVAPTTYYAWQIDTGSFEVTGNQVDMSGSFRHGLAMTNTLAGAGPQIIDLTRTVAGQTLSGSFMAESGGGINIKGFESGYCVLATCAGQTYATGFAGPAVTIGFLQFGGSSYGANIVSGTDIKINNSQFYGNDTQAILVAANLTGINISNNTFPLANPPSGYTINASGINIVAGTGDYLEATGSICKSTPCVTNGATGTNNKIELAQGPWSIVNGGTGARTKATAFDALSPMTTAGDIIYGGAAGTGTRLAAGTTNQVLHGGTTPSYSAVANADLTNSATTVNGQTCTLGSTCTVTATATSALTFGTHLITGGSSYNGSAPVTITSDATAVNTASTIMARDGSGQVAATTFTGALAGNATTATSATSATSATTATTATNATNTAITDDTTTNATMYPTWVTTTTGNLPQKVSSSKLNFNPSTGVLSSTSFTGAGTGLTGTSALTGVGTLTTGTWTATTIAVANGGTGDTGTAWSAYVPSLSCGAGTLTSASAAGRSKTLGKTTWVSIVVTITTNGSCASFISVTLPSTSQGSSYLGGRSSSGNLVGGQTSGSSSTLSYAGSTGSYVGGDGTTTVLEGVYEAN